MRTLISDLRIVNSSGLVVSGPPASAATPSSYDKLKEFVEVSCDSDAIRH